MAKQALVSIISVNFNETEATLEMLRSLKKTTYASTEVIVVDNGSRENPEEKILAEFPDVLFIRSNVNLGFAGGNNLAVARSNGDFLFFINNDTVVGPGLISGLVGQFSKIEKLGAISPKIYYHPDMVKGETQMIQYAGTTEVNTITGRNRTLGEKEIDTGQFTTEVETPYVHGAAMMISREVLEKVGPLPEVFFLYYEELDWCEKIRRAGFKVFIDPSVFIYHKESLAVGGDSPLKVYFQTRNRLLFMRRNQAGLRLVIFALFLILFTVPKNLLKYTLAGKWDHIKAFTKGIFWNLNHPKDRVSALGW
ncbi:MAG: glycosyltransferase family 2 protein, partial [Saprospiraceae bacterium]|nr:glycosyltransferase family 2 protein [Saprospiraceae bacterium]